MERQQNLMSTDLLTSDASGALPVGTPFPTPRMLPRASATVGRRLAGLAILGSVVLIGLLADDWVAGLAVAVLIIGIRVLMREAGPPIVAAAFFNQWLQVSIAVIYFALTGRMITEMATAPYRPMVLIGLACVVTLFAGFYVGSRLWRRTPLVDVGSRMLPWTTNQIAVVYGATIAASGIISELAWSMYGLTQVLLVFNRVRYVLLFLLMTRLVRPNPRWMFIVGILSMEVALGFARFFADFREPLVIVALAVLGATDRRQAKTWITLGVLGLLAISSGLIWTAIKPLIRKNYVATATSGQRLTAVVAVTGTTFAKGAVVWKYEGDSMVSRIWAVYFPALALQRVPSILPYENGAILKGAIANIVTPRLFFPNKPILPSQSDEVRKYAGVWVSGRENNTSYAFGYAGEAYVDFGVPLMFLPVLAFGLAMGVAYRFLQRSIRHVELRTGVIIVTFWSTLSVYEASWVMMIGLSLTILTVLGGSAILIDRMLLSVDRSHSKSKRTPPVKAWPGPERQPG